jgi:hypothetical protein
VINVPYSFLQEQTLVEDPWLLHAFAG